MFKLLFLGFLAFLFGCGGIPSGLRTYAANDMGCRSELRGEKAGRNQFIIHGCGMKVIYVRACKSCPWKRE